MSALRRSFARGPIGFTILVEASVKDETAHWSGVIRTAGLKPE